MEASIESDRQVAEWHQARLDQEERERRERSVPPPPYCQPAKYSSPPSAPPPALTTTSPVPQIDRASKPGAGPSQAPEFDRAVKPAVKSGGLRTVVLPGDLTDKFLSIARTNSGRGLETLGTLGGSLSNNRLVVTHLLIPKQVGKSDSCTMEGLEDVWDTHDKENIIFMGWIHTHPAYSVFLSSVDMHNQYEWQHMLPEVSEEPLCCSLLIESISGRGHRVQYQG